MIDVEKSINQKSNEETKNIVAKIQKSLEMSANEIVLQREIHYSERVDKILQSEIYDENSIEQLLYDLFAYGQSATIKQLYLQVCAFLERKNPELAERHVCMLWLKYGFDEGEERENLH